MFPLLYNDRSDFIHQSKEKELCKADLDYLEKNVDSIIYWTNDLILEMMKFLNEKTFKSHKAFLKWLLEEDDTYKEVKDWYESYGWQDIHKLK